MGINYTNRYSYDPNEAAIRTILGEAGNQGAQGQLAVADVIANRYKAGTWGSDIRQIVSPNQFNGFDATTPKDSARYQAAADAWAKAQAGNDITGGATYFANPSGSTASWAKNLSTDNALKIGDHYFTNNTQGKPFNPGTMPTGTSGGSAATSAPVQAEWYNPSTWFPAMDAAIKNLFVRGGAVLLALVLIAFGLYFLADQASGGKVGAITKEALLAA